MELDAASSYLTACCICTVAAPLWCGLGCCSRTVVKPRQTAVSLLTVPGGLISLFFDSAPACLPHRRSLEHSETPDARGAASLAGAKQGAQGNKHGTQNQSTAEASDGAGPESCPRGTCETGCLPSRRLIQLGWSAARFRVWGLCGRRASAVRRQPDKL